MPPNPVNVMDFMFFKLLALSLEVAGVDEAAFLSSSVLPDSSAIAGLESSGGKYGLIWFKYGLICNKFLYLYELS